MKKTGKVLLLLLLFCVVFSIKPTAKAETNEGFRHL